MRILMLLIILTLLNSETTGQSIYKTDDKKEAGYTYREEDEGQY